LSLRTRDSREFFSTKGHRGKTYDGYGLRLSYNDMELESRTGDLPMRFLVQVAKGQRIRQELV